MANMYNNVGAVYNMQGDSKNALLQHQKSLEIKLRVFSRKHPLVAKSYYNIGRVYEAQGKGEEALDQFKKSHEINIRVYKQNHPDAANSKYGMRRVYEERNEMDMARELFLECQRMTPRCMDPATVTRSWLQTLHSEPVGVPKRVSESDERDIHDPLVRRIPFATLLSSFIAILMNI